MPRYTQTQFLLTGGDDEQYANYLMIDPDTHTWSVQQYHQHVDNPDTFESVVHDRLYALVLPDNVDAEALSRGMTEHKNLLDQIAAGYTEEWHNTNLIGKLDENAQNALQCLADYASDAYVLKTLEVTDITDIPDDIDVPSLGEITAETSDVDLDRIAADVETALDNAGYIHYSGIPSALEYYRQNLEDDAQDDEDDEDDEGE